MTHVERDVATRALAMAADWELQGVCGESFLSPNATLTRLHGKGRRHFRALRAVRDHGASDALTNPNALLHKAARSRDPPRVAHRHGSDSLVRCFAGLQRRRAVILAAPHVAAALPSRIRVRIAGSALATAPLALARRPDPLDLTAVGELDAAGHEAGRSRPWRHRPLRAARRVHDHDGADARSRRLREARRRASTTPTRSASACAASCRSRRSAVSRLAATLSAPAVAIKSSSVPAAHRARRRESSARRRCRARAEHRRHGRHRREPRADARRLAALTCRICGRAPRARSRRRSAVAPRRRRRASDFAARSPSPAPPGCCSLRNNAPPSAVNLQPQTSAPTGPLMNCRTLPRSEPSVGQTKQPLLLSPG